MAPQSVYPPDRQLKVAAAHLARIAKAGDKEIHPANKRHEQDVFRDRVIGLVLSLRERDRHSTGTKPGGLLPQAADAARRLDDAYARMNKQDRDWVERIKPSQIQFLAGEIKDIQSTISNLSMLLHSALNKTYPMPKSPLHQKLGMNGPQVKNQMLRELVFGLLAAARDTGAKLTFNMNSESGTLADVLNRLRPYLPNGQLSQPLPARSIQRLKKEYFRLNPRFAA